MNHFRNKFTSPLISVCMGYVYMAIFAVFLYVSGLYSNSTFFRWGPPIDFMGTTVNDDKTYYLLLTFFFIHQLINNLVNNVTYPWIITCVQNPTSKTLVYSRTTSMIIVNMFALYSQLDVMLIIAGIMSQLSFFVVLTIANVLAVSVINWTYIRKHTVHFLIGNERIV
jgi:hypothetical protein